MVVDGDNEASVEISLMKGDAASSTTASPSEDVLVLTGKTGEFKIKAYAAAESKKVASQYVRTIANLNDKLEDNSKTISDLQRKLEALIKVL